MATLVVLGMMSVTWMAAVAVIAIGQKLLPATRAIDVPVALAMISFGLLILVAPSSGAGLTPSISM
jgi:predicted metal-binding membrane protein